MSFTTLDIPHGLSHTNLTTGGAVNAIAISNRLSRLRKKAADDGLMPKAGVTVPAKGSKGTAVSKKWNGGKMGGMVAEGPE